MVRRVVRALLEQSREMEVIGEAADGEQALLMAEQLRPNVVIMDISMPGQNGFEAAARIREKIRSARILFLSMYKSAGLVRRAMDVGADGYVLKRLATEELLTAVKQVNQGEAFFSQSLEVE